MSVSAVELRHILHKNPEPSFDEFHTTEILLQNIESLKSSGEDFRVLRPLRTGLILQYSPLGAGAPHALLRADIDALKMNEETDCAYRSANGYMHSCGHDVHSSILYGFIRRVIESNVKKNFLFLFQPGEETGGGAELIIKSGALDGFNISGAYALHVTDQYDEGVVASTPGVLFASAREVDLEFYGRAAHIAFASDGINALNAMRKFLDGVDSFEKASSEPFVFGVGSLTAGEVRNIIPAVSRLEGSIRALSTDRSDEFFSRLEALCESIKKTTGAGYSMKTGSYYPEVRLDSKLYEAVIKKISPGREIIDCGYRMTGEDFGFISRRYPAFMFWLGISRGERFGLHNPRFLPSDDVVEKGIEIFREILL